MGFLRNILRKWKGRNVSHADIDNLKPDALKWGFVSGESLSSVFQRRANTPREIQNKLNILRKLRYKPSEFLEGTQVAYRDVARQFVKAVEGKEGAQERLQQLVSPSLYYFMMDVAKKYQALGVHPQIEVQDVNPRIADVRVMRGLGEFSSSSVLLGWMHRRELLYHFTAGLIGPEGSTLRELNHPECVPKRLVVDVLFVVRESVSMLRRGNGPSLTASELADVSQDGVPITKQWLWTFECPLIRNSNSRRQTDGYLSLSASGASGRRGVGVDSDADDTDGDYEDEDEEDASWRLVNINDGIQTDGDAEWGVDESLSFKK